MLLSKRMLIQMQECSRDYKEIFLDLFINTKFTLNFNLPHRDYQIKFNFWQSYVEVNQI